MTMNNIAQQEEALFAEWSQKHLGKFYRDGVPDPHRYRNAKTKTLLFLREGNFEGEPHDYDFRGELLTNPGKKFWMLRIAPWCYGLCRAMEGTNVSWDSAKSAVASKSACIDALCQFGYIQLKKVAGGSTSSAKEIEKAVEQDCEFIRRQLRIYQPEVIIACGLGSRPTFDLLLAHVFGAEVKARSGSALQRRYAKVSAGDGSSPQTVVIETMHPSHRGRREKVYDQLISDYRQAVKLLRQPQEAAAATN